jgi:hypothetical protein
MNILFCFQGGGTGCRNSYFVSLARCKLFKVRAKCSTVKGVWVCTEGLHHDDKRKLEKCWYRNMSTCITLWFLKVLRQGVPTCMDMT